MKKKIDLFWYWFIFVVAFVLCFFAVNDKNINAYHLDSNGNVVSDNLIDIEDRTQTVNGVNYNIIDNKFFITGQRLYDNNFISVLSNDLLLNGSFTLYRSTSWKGNVNLRNLSNQNVCSLGWNTQFRTCTINDTIHSITFDVTGLSMNTVIDINGFITLVSGDLPLTTYEPFGTWYSSTNAENMYQGKLPSFTSSLIYTNTDNGNNYTINDLNSYIDSSFGYLYFDRLWTYLDTLTGSSYDDAKLTINFNENLNINTSYIINSNKENYGSGVWFYQNNDLMLDVRNFYDNEYCGGAVQYSCNVELNKYVNVGGGANSFSYLNKIVVWSGTTDERTLAFGYNNIGYNTGYDNGYSVGYNDGKNVSDSLIYNNGYTNGYNVGYDKGVNFASNGGNTLSGLVGAIFTAPVNMLQTIFDFEFLGINLTNFLFSLISLFIVIWLIRKFL